MLTQERLKELLNYDPETGIFTWRIDRSRTSAGDVAGCAHGRGYWKISIGADGLHLAHRLAWLYMTGGWPSGEIDHKDTDRRNNRWNNLRDLTRQGNAQNLRSARCDNKATGLLGVSRYKRKNGFSFRATITVDRRERHLGVFETPEAAHAAYVSAKRRFHPAGTL